MIDLIRDSEGLSDIIMYVAEKDGISPKKLAEIAGVAVYRISLFFTGGNKRALAQHHILKIADALGIQVKVVVGLK